MIYAVIDTNVIVSSLLTKQIDSPTVKIMQSIFSGNIKPIVSKEILEEYSEVLSRAKFNFSANTVNGTIKAFSENALHISPRASGMKLIDNDDVPFYDAAIASQKYGAFLVTGNTRHFPNIPFIITPAKFYQMI